jgi:hypothetical protein
MPSTILNFSHQSRTSFGDASAARVTSDEKTVDWSSHRIDGFLQLEVTALPTVILRDGVAARAHGRGRWRCCCAHLGGQVGGHRVDPNPGRVFPGARHARRLPGLPSPSVPPTSRTTRVTSDANERGWSTIVFSGTQPGLQDFAAHVDRYLLRQVAVEIADRHLEAAVAPPVRVAAILGPSR